MRNVFRMAALLLSAVVLTGCTSSAIKQSKAQAPASQELVRGEARTRAKARTDLGFEYYAQNQFALAIQEANVALKDDGSYAPAYNLLGLIYTALGDSKAADDAFLRALQISPGDPELANNYGWFLCQTKREPQSFRYFDDALQNPLYPTPLMALTNAAECALRIDDYKIAESHLQRALTVAPANVRALLLSANLKFRQKQYIEAREFLAEFHRNVEPSAGSTLLAYRIARLTENRDDEARYLALLRRKFSSSTEYRSLQGGTQ